jgi:exonuclease III
MHVSSNTPSDDWKYFVFSNLTEYTLKVCKMFKFLARRGSEDMPIILAGDFNVIVKDNCNAERKIPSNLTYFWIFLKEQLNLILATIWSLDKMWTIYPA